MVKMKASFVSVVFGLLRFEVSLRPKTDGSYGPGSTVTVQYGDRTYLLGNWRYEPLTDEIVFQVLDVTFKATT